MYYLHSAYDGVLLVNYAPNKVSVVCKCVHACVRAYEREGERKCVCGAGGGAVRA